MGLMMAEKIRIDEGMKKVDIEAGLSRIWDKERVVILIDHMAPHLAFFPLMRKRWTLSGIEQCVVMSR